VNSNKSNILFNNLNPDEEIRIVQIFPFNVSPFDNGVQVFVIHVKSSM
jgi:hypothetical protein